MLERYRFGFYDLVSAMEHLKTRAEMLESVSKPSNYEIEEVRKVIKRVRKECGTLSLRNTADLAELFEARYSVDQPTRSYSSDREYAYGSIKNDIEALNSSFRSELRRELLVRLSHDKEPYFERERLFGPKVSDAFPLCIEDIRHAGTCFALERYDACVFHLIQVLQAGINVLAQRLNVSFEYAQWERVLADIDKALFAAAASHFYFLKEAIRPTGRARAST